MTRRLKYELSDKTSFVYSIFDPFTSGDVCYPDNDRTMAVCKVITISKPIVTRSGADFHLVHVPFCSDPQRQLRLYVQNGTKSVFCQHILPDEDLADNFDWARLVTSGLMVRSSTVTGTNFTVAGTINAAYLASEVCYRDVTYNTLPSYTARAQDVVASVPVMNGVVTLSGLAGDYEYRCIRDGQVVATDALCTLRDSLADEGNFPRSGFLTPPSVTTLTPNAIVYDSDDPTSNLDLEKYNLFGRLRIRASCPIQQTAGIVATNGEMSMWMTTIVMDTTTWLPATIVTQVSQHFNLSVGGTTTINFDFPYNHEAEITRVQMILNVSTPATTVSPMAISNDNYRYVEVESAYAYSTNERTPLSFLSISGMGVGQQLAIASRSHYEVVPNSSLARNLKVNYPAPGFEMEVELAEAVIRNPDNNCALVYEMNNYLATKSSAYFNQLKSFEGAGLYAGDTWDWLKSKWGSFVKNYGQQAKTAVNTIAPSLLTLSGVPEFAPLVPIASDALFGNGSGRLFAMERSTTTTRRFRDDMPDREHLRELESFQDGDDFTQEELNFILERRRSLAKRKTAEASKQLHNINQDTIEQTFEGIDYLNVWADQTASKEVDTDAGAKMQAIIQNQPWVRPVTIGFFAAVAEGGLPTDPVKMIISRPGDQKSRGDFWFQGLKHFPLKDIAVNQTGGPVYWIPKVLVDEEDVKQALFALHLAGCPSGTTLTFMTDQIVNGGSFGLAVYATAMGWPADVIISGKFDTNRTNGYIAPTILPVTGLQIKLEGIKSMSKLFITPITRELLDLPQNEVVYPMDLVSGWNRFKDRPDPKVVLIVNLCEAKEAMLRFYRHAKEKRAEFNAALAPKLVDVVGDSDIPDLTWFKDPEVLEIMANKNQISLDKLTMVADQSNGFYTNQLGKQEMVNEATQAAAVKRIRQYYDIYQAHAAKLARMKQAAPKPTQQATNSKVLEARRARALATRQQEQAALASRKKG